jgi:protein-disulfide isomerase
MASVGLITSVFLFVQYSLPPAAGGCPVLGDCHVVRACRVAGISSGIWPQVGFLGLLAVLLLSLSNRGWARRLLPYVSTLGALIAGGLLVSQRLVCGAFCPYCIVVDSAAILAAAGAWLGRGEAPAISGKARWAHALLVLAGAGGSIGWGVQASRIEIEPVRIASLPPSVERDQQPEVVTIVKIMEFWCPHCRQQHPELKQAIAPYGKRVRVLHRYMGLNEAGENAARAQYCAESQGRGEPMFEALITAEDFSRPGCEAIASRVGLDIPSYRQCIDAPETAARLEEDRRVVQEAVVAMLPTLFVGHDRYDGNASAARLRASIDGALGSAPDTKVSAPPVP